MKVLNAFVKVFLSFSFIWLIVFFIIVVMGVFVNPMPYLAAFLMMPLGILGTLIASAVLIVYLIYVLKAGLVKEKIKNLIALVACIMIWLLSWSSYFIPQKPFDLANYALYQSTYQMAAESLCYDLADAEDTDGFVEYQGQVECMSRVPEKNREIRYFKSGDHLMIDFSASTTFFYDSGFLYYTDAQILNCLIKKYSEDTVLENQKGVYYEESDSLKTPGWMYMIW